MAKATTVAAAVAAAIAAAAFLLNPSPAQHRAGIKAAIAERSPLAGAIGIGALTAFASTYHPLGIASYCVLFAVMGGSGETLVIELTVGAVLIVAAVAGFRSSPWLVVAALLAHGIFDFVRGAAISNPWVPVWWPQFCLVFGVTAAGYLAWLLKSSRQAS